MINFEIPVALVEEKDVNRFTEAIVQDVQNGVYKPDVYEIGRWLVIQLNNMSVKGIKYGETVYAVPNEVPKFVMEVLGPALKRYDITLKADSKQLHLTPKMLLKLLELSEHVIANTGSRDVLEQVFYDMFSGAFFDSIEYAGKIYELSQLDLFIDEVILSQF